MSDVSVSLGSSDELEEGAIRAFALEQEEGGKVLVARQGGNLYGFQARCTHADCDLSSGFVEDGTIECPCHGSEFDLGSGEVLDPPATDPIRTYAVRESDGEIVIELG